MGYDFSKLNDREFEALGASIIEKTINKKLKPLKQAKTEESMAGFGLIIKKGLFSANVILKLATQL